MRLLLNGEPFRQDLLAERVKQEGRFTVDAAAADGADQMAEEAGGDFRRENHRRFHGRELARRQPRQHATRALCANPLGTLQILEGATDGIGVVALHIAILLGDNGTGERMTARAVALQHAVAVAEDFNADVAVEATAFGIGNTRIRFQRRLLRLRGELDGAIGVDLPGMIEIEIRRVERQQIGIRRASIRIRRGVARDIDRRLHGTFDRLRAKVGR